MDIVLDRQSLVSVGEQINAQIRVLIHNGELPPDDLLPTVNELANSLNINYNTVAAAYRALEAEGYLVQRRRAGTRVAPAPPKSAEEGLAVHLTAGFAEDVAASGLDANEVVKLFAAQVNLRGRRAPLKVAVLAHSPLQAAALAERAGVLLGADFRCVPGTVDAYRSADYHLTLVHPDLLVTLRGALEPSRPLFDASPWPFDQHVPAGAD